MINKAKPFFGIDLGSGSDNSAVVITRRLDDDSVDILFSDCSPDAMKKAREYIAAYGLPPPRIRSDLEAYLDDGNKLADIEEKTYQQDHIRRTPTSPLEERWSPGEIFLTQCGIPKNTKYPYKVLTLKIALGQYRYGHSKDELKAIAVLHGLVPKE